MATVSFLSYRNADRLTDSAAQLRKSNETLQVLSDIAIALTATEFRRPDDILLSDLEELEQSKTVIQRLEPQITELEKLLFATPSQQHHFSTLKFLLTQRLNLFQQSIKQHQEKSLNSDQTSLVPKLRQNQKDLHEIIAALRIEEENLLKDQGEFFRTGFNHRMLIEIIGTLLTFMLLFGIYGVAVYQRNKRQQAEARQQTLVQAKVLSELKLQFFSMVSHEFRTPLSHILGSAQLLEETLERQVELAKLKNLYRIQASAKLMTQLLNDVLTLARADAGKLECTPVRVEMQTFCLNLIEDFQLFSEAQHSIKFYQQGDRTYAWVDEKLIRSILSNLLSNAIKYSPPASTIYFTFKGDSAAITFQIRDEGVGIPPEDLSRLYSPFIRGTNTKETIGTGLGLAVVKKCLDLHGGQVWVESQVGYGTTFTVEIPQSTD